MTAPGSMSGRGKGRAWVRAAVRRSPTLVKVYRGGKYLVLGRSRIQRFQAIWARNMWGSDESVSGRGSDLEQTEALRRELPRLLDRLAVSSLLDVPCGDTKWIREAGLSDDLTYIGMDIVPELIETNRRSPQRIEWQFVEGDLCEDKLPSAELIMCRDCLVHFSYRDIYRALDNVVASDANYLLTTTFPAHRNTEDIPTGSWRPLNLQDGPFNFPEPRDTIIEGCTEGDGAFADKALSLWLVEDLRRHLAASPRQISKSNARRSG